MLKRLPELRKNKKWTLQETADRLGIAKSTYAGYESGYREPSLEAISQIADLFDTTVDYILNRDDHKFTKMELMEQLNENLSLFTVDGLPLSKDELIDVIAFIRTKRDLRKQID